jgi:hypothetical protein
MKPIPETRTELIDLFTSEKILCFHCNQNQIFKQRSDIHCPLIPRHSGHVVLECLGCGTMTTIDRLCDGFTDLRDLMKSNQYKISKDEHSIAEYPEWLSSYSKPSLEHELIYPTNFNWEEYWKEIQTHTDFRSLIGFKDKLIPDFGYSFDVNSGGVVVSHPEEGQFRISLSDFKKMHEKMEKNRIENKDGFDDFSDL